MGAWTEITSKATDYLGALRQLTRKDNPELDVLILTIVHKFHKNT